MHWRSRSWSLLRFLAFLHVLSFVALSPSPARSMTLAEDGRALATIVIAEQARERERLAARELAHYLGRMSGAAFEVTTEAGDGPTIFVGGMPQTEPILHALRGQKAQADSFVIRCRGDRLYLVGSDYKMKTYKRADAGTCHAVYTLLDEFGCKWYFPGALGEIVPKRNKLEVAEQDRHVRPSFWHRGDIWGPSEDWVRRNRGGGPYRAVTGHSYMRLVPPAKYEKEHPEYYAVIDGRRWPGMGLCTSNPEVVRIATEAAREAVRRSGFKLVAVAPPDTPWLCECDDCRALDPPQFRRAVTRKQEEAMYGGYVAGNSQGRSDRVVHFANAVARGLRDEFPDASVLNFAYWGYMEAPVKYTPEPNVICWYTLWTTTGVRAAYPYSAPGNERAQKVFLDNAKVYGDMMLYAYYGHFSVQTYYPVAEQIAVDLPWFNRNGAGGFYSETHAHWITQGLNFYTMYRVSWDVNTDTQAMFDGYYRNLFGPAAATMRRFDGLFRDAYLSHPKAREKLYVPDTEAYTEPVLRQARMLFNEAKRQAAGNDVVLERLAYFERGLEVTEIWCRAWHDLGGALGSGSLVLARRAKAGFLQIDGLVKAEGFAYNRWEHQLAKALRRTDRVIDELGE